MSAPIASMDTYLEMPGELSAAYLANTDGFEVELVAG